jgi:hypothetical protein
MTYQWSLPHLIGYLQTWSAVKHYQAKTGSNPIDLIMEELRMAWGEAEQRTVNFPLLLRVGRINKAV